MSNHRHTPLLLPLLCLFCIAPSLSQDRPDARRRDPAAGRQEITPREQERPARLNLLPRPTGDSVSGGATRRLNRPSRSREQEDSPRNAEVRRIFEAVEDGLSNAVIGRFSSHFAPHVSMNLRAGESGSFSANQAYYVLEKYLRSRRFTRVTLGAIAESPEHPYATGTTVIPPGDGRETAQVYVELSRVGERWMITQINIY